jgi:hypothetical protein
MHLSNFVNSISRKRVLNKYWIFGVCQLNSPIDKIKLLVPCKAQNIDHVLNMC